MQSIHLLSQLHNNLLVALLMHCLQSKEMNLIPYLLWGEFQELQPIEGLEISAVSADLYGDGRDDLALFYFQEGANFAAVYTTSSVTSASINWNLKIKRHFVKALMVNTKNANTLTGIKGAQGLKEIANSLAKKS